MKPKTQNLIGCGVLLILLFVGVLGYGAYKIYSFFNNFTANKEVPTELKETRITVGENFLQKNIFFTLDKQGLLKTISDSSKVQDEKERQRVIESQVAKGIYKFADLKVINNEIIAVGKFGGFVFDFDGNLKRQILFEPSKEKIKIAGYEQESYKSNLDNLQIVELEKGKLGFISFGSVQGAIVFDENGNQIWTKGKEQIDLNILWKDEKERDEAFEKMHSVLEATVGDLDGDGVSEYIVSIKNEGIYAFDRNGVQKWFESDKFASNKLQVIDIDGDGKNELLEVGSKIRNGITGKVIREIKGYDKNAVLISETKDKKKLLLFCDVRKNKFLCKDETEKTIIEGNAPLSEIKNEKPLSDIPYETDSESVYEPKAVWMVLKKDKPKYLAIIASFISFPRSNLYVYDEKGTLVYHELLAEDAETIAVLPNQNGNESILVGGKDTIWKFSAN